MNIDKLTIGNVRELTSLFKNAVPFKDGEIHIVVLSRGRVHVGKCYYSAPWIRIEDAKCIRRWGTTSGLGQLSQNGPTGETKLDAQGPTTAHELTVVEMILCDQIKW